MAAKAIKSLELHYTMIQFLIIKDSPSQVNNPGAEFRISPECWSPYNL